MTALTTLTGCSGGDHKKQTKPRVCPIHSQEVRTAILDRMNLCVPPEVGILHTPRLTFGWSGVKAPTLTALTALTGGAGQKSRPKIPSTPAHPWSGRSGRSGVLS